jgi:hypothetical protein
MEVTEEGFTVKKARSEIKRLLPFSEAQLLDALTHELVHGDLLTELLATEF